MTEVLSERVLDRVPFRDLGFSRLFADYCDAAAPAVSFFGSHFRSDLNARLRQVPPFDATSRGILVDVLSEQNARWQASPATHDNIDRLSNPGARCIVTGQQLGLFVSPLYTIYKSLTTLHLAAKLSTDEIPVVPVFWLADEDHDLDEIDHCLLPGKDGVARIEYPRGFDSQGPTGALIVDSDSQRALSELRTHLSDLPYAESILNDIEACYASGVSFADAFASLLHRILPGTGLVICSGADSRLKERAIPLFERSVREADALDQTLSESTKRIEAAYHAQLHIRNTNLFLVQDGVRSGVDRRDGQFELKGSGRSFSEEELVGLIRSQPGAVSPNVVLRPIYQDLLFPTLAYVGGPGEVAYYAQIRPAYDWAGIQMPIIYPRASLSLMDGSASRLIKAEGLAFTELSARPEQLFRDLVIKRMSVDVDASIGNARDQADVLLNELLLTASRLDPTLDGSVEAIRAQLRKRLDRLGLKFLRAEKRKHDLLEEQVQRSTSFLFPDGKLQERTFLPAYFLARYGPNYFVRLLDDLDADTSHHFVLRA